MVKSVRFDRLLASTALGLGLVAVQPMPGMAQQTGKQIQASVPTPDVAMPPPTAKDVAASTSGYHQANRKPIPPILRRRPDAATPAAEPAKAASAPAAGAP